MNHHALITCCLQTIFYSFAAMAVLWLPLWLPVPVKPQRNALQLPQAPDGNGGGISAAAMVKGGPALLDQGFWALLKRKEVCGWTRSQACNFSPSNSLSHHLLPLAFVQVWAICIAQYTGSWGMYGLLNWLPTFFSDYYHVSGCWRLQLHLSDSTAPWHIKKQSDSVFRFSRLLDPHFC